MRLLGSAEAVDCYVGGALRLAALDPQLGAAWADGGFILRLSCTDVPAHVTLSLHDPVVVAWNDAHTTPDVELKCSSAFLDAYLRGERDLRVALAHGEVVARGRVSKALKILPVLERGFAHYPQLAAIGEQAEPRMTGVLA